MKHSLQDIARALIALEHEAFEAWLKDGSHHNRRQIAHYRSKCVEFVLAIALKGEAAVDEYQNEITTPPPLSRETAAQGK